MRSEGEADMVLASMLASVSDPLRRGCRIGSPKFACVAIVTGDAFIVVHEIAILWSIGNISNKGGVAVPTKPPWVAHHDAQTCSLLQRLNNNVDTLME